MAAPCRWGARLVAAGLVFECLEGHVRACRSRQLTLPPKTTKEVRKEYNMNKKLIYITAVLMLPVLILSACSMPSYSLRNLTSQGAAASTPAAAVQNQQAQAVTATQAQTQTAPITSDTLATLQSDLESIYQSVNPSVVNIQVVESAGSTQQLPGFPSLPPNTPQQSGLASGFVWDTQGHIVTNYHVVDGAQSITVQFSDETTVPAKVVGTDPNADLAVIQVDVPASQLVPVTMADSTTLKVGQLAVAIGNPFGYEGSMTVGFISALGRTLPVSSSGLFGSTSGSSFTIPDIIQTDAPINPGNSGGVLVNDHGQVIGVPTAIESQSGSNSGIGFAIPSAIVQKEVPVLITDGRYDHTYLGISGTTLTSDLAQAMGLPATQRGALVISVTSGGPAEAAGLQASTKQANVNGQQEQVGGDVIVAIDGQPVKQFDDLVSYLASSTTVGQKVTLTILRDGKEQQVDVTLAARPSSPQASSSGPGQGTTGGAWLGIMGLTVTPDIAQAMGLSQNQSGVLVEQVVSSSPAEAAGLQGSSKTADINGQQVAVGGDIITAAGGQKINSLGDLRAFLAEAQPGQQVTLTVLRAGNDVQVDVTLGQQPNSSQQ